MPREALMPSFFIEVEQTKRAGFWIQGCTEGEAREAAEALPSLIPESYWDYDDHESITRVDRAPRGKRALVWIGGPDGEWRSTP
jgi:hypothetical protein